MCAEKMNGRDVAILMHAFAVMRIQPGRKTLDAIGFRAAQILQERSMQGQVSFLQLVCVYVRMCVHVCQCLFCVCVFVSCWMPSGHTGCAHFA